jgi:DNA-directed RNA polymerase specialized sigma24 family protein
MSTFEDDNALARAYANSSSETAFLTLMNCHLDWVYATALRQLGNSEAAQEVSQNVFLILARKAPRLANCQTLTGWLHRAVLLECKARIYFALHPVFRGSRGMQLGPLPRGG